MAGLKNRPAYIKMNNKMNGVLKMKKLLNLVGLAVLCFFALANTPELKAQIQSEFYDIKTVEKNYEPLGNKGQALTHLDFYLPPASVGNGTYDADNGYKKVPLGFSYEYNGEIYTEVWICINGFITFADPLNLPQDKQEGLFLDVPSSYQTNVIAPFWGDHKYRLASEDINGYLPSAIRYESGNASNNYTFTVEWKNLQINKFPNDVKSSVANFQVKLYMSQDQYSKQGDIEFCYGQVGGNPNTPLTDVVTKNATVGIKGDFGDFINGVHYNDPLKSRTLTTRTNEWTPSGATNKRIMFEAKKSFKIDEFWGDGDVDFSKAEGNRHYGLPQQRYVTINDARIIMRSMATKMKLDSVRRKEAYHADVNHNGRYFYTSTGERYDIPQRDVNYADNLPNGISSYKKIYYQVTEMDASLILNFLSARVPVLPWRYDTVLINGKIINTDDIANNIKIGEIIHNDNGTVTLPIHLNGNSVGAVAGKFELNQNVISVEKNTSIEENVLIDNNDNLVVFAASGEFNSEEPLFYVTINESNNILLSNIIFKDNKVGSLSSVNTADNNVTNMSNYPNPFNSTTNITMNIAQQGKYTLEVFDVMGNLVSVIANNEYNVGTVSIPWNGTDANGNAVANGMYIYKLTGNNNVVTNTMIVNK